MREYGNRTRREMFLELDFPQARKLPDSDSSLRCVRTNIKVRNDYHIFHKGHYFSLPFKHIGQRIDIHESQQMVEIYHNGVHLCRHSTKSLHTLYVTNPEHMPLNHRFMKLSSPEKIVDKAKEIGQAATRVAEILVNNQKHPEVGCRMGWAFLSLRKRFGDERLEKASIRGLYYNATSVVDIKSILEQNLENIAIVEQTQTVTHLECNMHENIRGASYYHSNFSEEKRGLLCI